MRASMSSRASGERCKLLYGVDLPLVGRVPVVHQPHHRRHRLDRRLVRAAGCDGLVDVEQPVMCQASLSLPDQPGSRMWAERLEGIRHVSPLVDRREQRRIQSAVVDRVRRMAGVVAGGGELLCVRQQLLHTYPLPFPGRSWMTGPGRADRPPGAPSPSTGSRPIRCGGARRRTPSTTAPRRGGRPSRSATPSSTVASPPKTAGHRQGAAGCGVSAASSAVPHTGQRAADHLQPARRRMAGRGCHLSR